MAATGSATLRLEPTTVIPLFLARRAIALPIEPRPITPSVALSKRRDLSRMPFLAPLLPHNTRNIPMHHGRAGHNEIGDDFAVHNPSVGHDEIADAVAYWQ